MSRVEFDSLLGLFTMCVTISRLKTLHVLQSTEPGISSQATVLARVSRVGTPYILNKRGVVPLLAVCI